MLTQLEPTSETNWSSVELASWTGPLNLCLSLIGRWTTGAKCTYRQEFRQLLAVAHRALVHHLPMPPNLPQTLTFLETSLTASPAQIKRNAFANIQRTWKLSVHIGSRTTRLDWRTFVYEQAEQWTFPPLSSSFSVRCKPNKRDLLSMRSQV
jgi:hypothetical protein